MEEQADTETSDKKRARAQNKESAGEHGRGEIYRKKRSQTQPADAEESMNVESVGESGALWPTAQLPPRGASLVARTVPIGS